MEFNHYDYYGRLCGGLARVKQYNKWGVLNKEGKEIIPLKFEEIVSLSYYKGLLGVKENGKWCLFNRKGSKITHGSYDDIFPFYGKFGISKVKINDLWGLINKDGEELTAIRYEIVEVFGKGFLLKPGKGKNEYFDFDKLFRN